MYWKITILFRYFSNNKTYLYVFKIVMLFKGVWSDRAGSDGTDINAIARSGDLLAVGDDLGKTRLYAYPAIQQKVHGRVEEGRRCPPLHLSIYFKQIKFSMGPPVIKSWGNCYIDNVPPEFLS